MKNPEILKTAAGFAACAEGINEPQPIRFMTFNIYGSGYGDKFMAAEREDRAIAVVRKYAPDLISWQEVNGGWWQSKLFTTMDEFAVIRGNEDEALVRAGADLSKRKANWVNHEPLMVRKSRFQILDSGLDFYHISIQFEKSLTWAVLEDKLDGSRFIAFATHFWWQSNGPESDAIRELNVRHVLWRTDAIRVKWGDLPVVLGGDLNCLMDSLACRTLVQNGYDDAGETAPVRSNIPSEHGALVRDEQGKCRGRVGKIGEKGHKMIDHIFFTRNRMVPLKHDVVVDQEAIDISDHSPVILDFTLAASEKKAQWQSQSTMRLVTSEWEEHRLQQSGRHVFVPYYTSPMWNDACTEFMYLSADADLRDAHLHVYSVKEHKTLCDFPMTPKNKASFGGSLVTAVAWWANDMLILTDGPDVLGFSVKDGSRHILWEAPDRQQGKLECGTLSPNGKLLAEGSYFKDHTEVLVFSVPDFKLRYRHDFGSFLANHFQFLPDSKSLMFAHEGKTEGIDDRINRLDLESDTCTCIHRHYRDLLTGEQMECIGHEMAAANADFICAVRYPVSRLPGAIVAMGAHGERYCEIDQDDFWHVSCNDDGTVVVADTMWWGHTCRKTGNVMDILKINIPEHTKEIVKTIRQYGNGQHQHAHPHPDKSGRQILFMEASDENPNLATLTLRIQK